MNQNKSKICKYGRIKVKDPSKRKTKVRDKDLRKDNRVYILYFLRCIFIMPYESNL